MTQTLEEEAKTKKNKVLRVITGFIIAVIALAAIVLGSFLLYAMLGIILILCSREYIKILNHKGFYPSWTVTMFAAIVFLTLTFFHRFDLVPFMLTFVIMASFLSVLFKGRQPYIVNVATTILGALYCAWLPCHILLIRQIGMTRISAFQFAPSDGLWFLMFVFVAVAMTDIGAYYFGVKFGKHKLAEVISPKKTIEGAIGGGICAVLFSCLGVFYANLTLCQALVGGLIITLSAQLGDLSESLIKRDAGVKDSSNMLPGHGGFLDRTDSYIMTVPVIYYYLQYFVHSNTILDLFKGLF